MSIVKRVSGNYTIQSINSADVINLNSSTVVVNGNLQVIGNSQNIVNFTTSNNSITLNNGVTSPNPLGASIIVSRGTSPNVAIKWDEFSGTWKITNDGTHFYPIATMPDTGPFLPTGILQEPTVISASTTISGNVVVGISISIGAPAVITSASHGFVAGSQVVFATTGALPTGIIAGKVYYVITAGLTANTFEISATDSGTAIITSGTQSGTHSVYAPYIGISYSPITVADGVVITIPSGNYWIIEPVNIPPSAIPSVYADTAPKLSANLNITSQKLYDSTANVQLSLNTVSTGGSGVFVTNSTYTNQELATKNRAFAYSIIFG